MGTNAIVTEQRRKDLVKASSGDILLPTIVGMAFGDGGCDNDGNVITPTEVQSELNHEIYRKEVDGHSFVSETTCRYECSLSSSELADQNISEIGLYDSNGNLVNIKTFKSKGKDSDLEMTFTVDDVF